MVRSGRVMQMKSCIIKYDLSVCRIFFVFFVHTARSSIAVARNALVVLNALVILHACTHSIIVHDRCNCDCCDRRSRVIRFNGVFRW